MYSPERDLFSAVITQAYQDAVRPIVKGRRCTKNRDIWEARSFLTGSFNLKAVCEMAEIHPDKVIKVGKELEAIGWVTPVAQELFDLRHQREVRRAKIRLLNEKVQHGRLDLEALKKLHAEIDVLNPKIEDLKAKYRTEQNKLTEETMRLIDKVYERLSHVEGFRLAVRIIHPELGDLTVTLDVTDLELNKYSMGMMDQLLKNVNNDIDKAIVQKKAEERDKQALKDVDDKEMSTLADDMAHDIKKELKSEGKEENPDE